MKNTKRFEVQLSQLRKEQDGFCEQFGEPCDWNYNKLKCNGCNEELEIQGADW